MASSNRAEFHAFITKVNNSAIFRTTTAVLSCVNGILSDVKVFGGALETYTELFYSDFKRRRKPPT